jgi:hypothetical protein
MDKLESVSSVWRLITGISKGGQTGKFVLQMAVLQGDFQGSGKTSPYSSSIDGKIKAGFTRSGLRQVARQRSRGITYE